MKRNSSLILTTFFIITILLTVSTPSAFAQRPTQQILQELEKQDKFGCEVWQINEFFHLPVRVNFIHESVTDHQVKVTSQDPASEVFWKGSKTSFQMETDSPDRHRVEVVLDYELKHEEPRQVYFQVFSQDNVMMMEGNWRHEGFTFCKVIEFSASEAPHILTAEEIQEENNKFNADFRKENAEKFTSLENAQITYGILLLIIGIAVGAFLIVAVLMYRKVANVANKPVKKLETLADIHRNINKNFENVTERFLQLMNEMKGDVTKNVDGKINDMMLIINSLKKELDSLIALKTSIANQVETVEPTLLSNDISKNEPSKPNKETNGDHLKEPTERKESTLKKTVSGFAKIIKGGKHGKPEPKQESTKESGGFIPDLEAEHLAMDTSSPEDLKMETDGQRYIDSDKLRKDEKRTVDHDVVFDDNGIVEHTTVTKREYDQNEDVLEMDEIPECDTCGQVREDMLLCPACNRVYCSQHEPDHKCIQYEEDVKEGKTLESVKKFANVAKGQFIEPKDLPLDSDDAIERELALGKTMGQLEERLVEQWMTRGRKINDEEYRSLQKSYKMDPKVVTAIKINAMLKVLNKQVR